MSNYKSVTLLITMAIAAITGFLGVARVLVADTPTDSTLHNEITDAIVWGTAIISALHAIVIAISPKSK